MDPLYSKKPTPFFKGNDELVVVSRSEFVGLNVGYESLEWRYDAFTEHLFQWLLEFVLPYSDLKKINHANAVAAITKAANIVYATEKYQNRGEFGELILHAILRELFDTEPIVNKMYFKSAVNDTVKGFDAVHARCDDDGCLELWLGEVKFYTEIGDAIHDVSGEITSHLCRSKLREEFMCVGNRVDPAWPHAQEVNMLFDPKTSLDDVFKVMCVPVLLTYESQTVQSAKKISDVFLSTLRDELERHHASFRQKILDVSVKVVLVLLPLDSKQKLVDSLNARLRGFQA